MSKQNPIHPHATSKIRDFSDRLPAQRSFADVRFLRVMLSEMPTPVAF